MKPRHRVEITFEAGYGPSAKLICPEGGCEKPGWCAECGRALNDPDDTSEGCYDCRDATWCDECWLKTWFDNLSVDDLLAGKLVVEIDGIWTGDGAVAQIVGTAAEVVA
jgi:hypothetical protein